MNEAPKINLGTPDFENPQYRYNRILNDLYNWAKTQDQISESADPTNDEFKETPAEQYLINFIHKAVSDDVAKGEYETHVDGVVAWQISGLSDMFENYRDITKRLKEHGVKEAAIEYIFANPDEMFSKVEDFLRKLDSTENKVSD